jgi:transcription elongation GreA/GreB family factor
LQQRQEHQQNPKIQQKKQKQKLREKLKQLRIKKDKIVFEKGLAAQDNKDLRENSAYDYWDRKEHFITTRIHKLINEIEKLAKNNKKR